MLPESVNMQTIAAAVAEFVAGIVSWVSPSAASWLMGIPPWQILIAAGVSVFVLVGLWLLSHIDQGPRVVFPKKRSGR